MSVNNYDDIIDSRDVIARIEEIKEWMDYRDGDRTARELKSELSELESLDSEGRCSAAGWDYGASLIRDTYFEQYAQEFAEETGMINPDATWPNNYIDWSRAARELQYYYTSSDFGGVDYWVRS